VVDLGAEASATLAKHPALKGGLLALKAAAAVGAEQRRIAREAFRLLADDEWTRDLYLRYLGHVGGKKMESTLMRAAREELRPGEGERRANVGRELVEPGASTGASTGPDARAYQRPRTGVAPRAFSKALNRASNRVAPRPCATW
jgi:hypothetical protein